MQRAASLLGLILFVPLMVLGVLQVVSLQAEATGVTSDGLGSFLPKLSGATLIIGGVLAAIFTVGILAALVGAMGRR